MFGDGGGEGDDVVADFGFDLLDAGDGEVAAVADGVGAGWRDEAEAGEGLRGGGFDGEPAAVLVLVGPDAAHGGACVASDHGRDPGASRTGRWEAVLSGGATPSNSAISS